MGKKTPPRRAENIVKKFENGSPFLKIKTKDEEKFPIAEKEMAERKREIKNTKKLKSFKGKENKIFEPVIIIKILIKEFEKS